MNFAEIGQAIRGGRARLNLTQGELAKSLGMSRATLSRVETGTIPELGVRKLARLAQRVGLELALVERRRPSLHQASEENREEQRQAVRLVEQRAGQSPGGRPDGIHQPIGLGGVSGHKFRVDDWSTAEFEPGA